MSYTISSFHQNPYALDRECVTPLLEDEDPLPSLLTQNPMSFTARAVYTLTKPIFLFGLYRGYFTSLYGLAGYSISIRMAEEFLLDMGGHMTTIASSDGAQLQAMYFDTEVFLQNEDRVYQKWKTRFSDRRQLAEILEVNFEGENLRELMRLPKEVIDPCHPHKKAVVHCLGAGTIFEMNPQYVMQSLYRGLNHLAFNYRGIHKGVGTPSYEGTCNDAFFAVKHVRDYLNCQNHQITVVGTSMGGGPALFAARLLPGLDVVLDRTFSRLSAVHINSRFQRPFAYLAEKFYRYPNDEWIGKIEGHVCIIHARGDELIDRSHAERLIHAFEKDHQAKHSRANFIDASGGHGGRYKGVHSYSWYTDGVTQSKYSKAIMGTPVSDQF